MCIYIHEQYVYACKHTCIQCILFSSHSSLPITSPQGHVLGRLHIIVELEVARAGQTNLMGPAAVGTLSGFTVGPGASLKARRSELQELHAEQVPGSLQNKLISTSNAENSRQSAHHTIPSSESVATHKAALLAKYMEPSPTEPCLGPKQHEVLAELIERGERLRDAMVASVLNSGKGGDGVVSGRGRGGEKEGEGGKGVTDGKSMRQEYVYSSDDNEVDDKFDFSMDESDYPLHDPSLLEQLLYSVRLLHVFILTYTLVLLVLTFNCDCIVYCSVPVHVYACYL